MKKEIFLIALIFICIVSFFFYPLFKGKIPFPGDLLVNTNPYNSLSLGGYAPGGIPNKAQGVDVIRESYPWKHFVIESFKKGSIAFWNPYDFSGNPMMANFQSGTFYPLNLIFFPLPFNYAWTLFIFLIPVLSAQFTYLYLREIKIGKIAALFAGIVFAFSSYMVVWMQYGNIGHTILWLPLGLLLTEKLIHDFKRKYLLLLIVVLFTASLAGYIQGYFYTILILLYYYFVKSIYNKNLLTIQTIIYVAAVLFPLLLSSFQLLPTLELFQNSSRGNYSLDAIGKLLNPWWYIITVLAPDFFGNPATGNHFFFGTYIERVSYFGVIPLILALSSLFLFKKIKETAIFGLILIVSLFLSYDILFTKFLYLFPIPVISTTVPTRILSLFVFSGSVLAGIGLQLLLKGDKRKYFYLASGIALVLLIIGWIAAVFNHSTISQRNLILPSAIVTLFVIYLLFFFNKKNLRYLFIIAIFALTLFDLFRFFHKITPFSPSEYVYPATPIISYLQKNAGINRHWGYGSGQIQTNIQLIDHTFVPDGHDALHARNYAEFIATSKDGKTPPLLSRSDSEVAPGFGATDFRNNYYRKKILNILGVKFVTMKNEEISDDPAFESVWKEGSWQIYENLHVVPRVFITDDYIVLKNKKDIIPAFYDKNFDEKKTIILEEDPSLQKNNLQKKQIKILKYDQNTISIRTLSDADAMLFLSDTLYPGWKAAVDGKPAKIYSADYAFRAVKVPKGEHEVSFYYFPQSFKNGLILSGLALFSLVVIYFLLFNNKYIFCKNIVLKI